MRFSIGSRGIERWKQLSLLFGHGRLATSRRGNLLSGSWRPGWSRFAGVLISLLLTGTVICAATNAATLARSGVVTLRVTSAESAHGITSVGGVDAARDAGLGALQAGVHADQQDPVGDGFHASTVP